MSADTPIVRANALDYNQAAYSHGTLQFVPTFPNQYGTPILLTTGQTPVVFNLPTEVFNFGMSELMFTVNIAAAGANNYIWTPDDTISEISHIQFYGSSNQLIADLDNLQNYYKIVGKHEKSISDFQTNDPINPIYPSNALINNIPALRVQSGVGIAPTPSSLNYVEPAYFSVGAVNTAVAYDVLIPLREIKNTILAMDKNFYFNQITYLKIYFGPITKIGFVSTSNATPNGAALAGGIGISDLVAAAGTNIANLQLMLATETNEAERLRLINGVQSGSISMIIPYAYCYKNPNNGTSQNINIQMDIGSGRTVERIYHSVFNNVEDLNLCYDCSNQNVTGTTSEKVNQYYTNLNGRRVQTITIDTSGTQGHNLDYMNMKNSLKGSVLENMNVFKYNWHHLDDFCSFSTEYVQDGKTELISGYALGPTPITWTFVGASMTNANFMHYTYAIFTKRLTIGATGPMVD